MRESADRRAATPKNRHDGGEEGNGEGFGPGKNSARRENSFKDERPANDLFSIRKS